jgi:periplasmic copper chaperone A
MKKLIVATIVGITISFSTSTLAQVVAKDAWVRTTVAQQKVTGAFMQLQSPKAVKVISASSPISDTVEIHTMEIQGEVMKMRAINSLDIPAGQVVELKPGSYHIMLFNLKSQVKAGDIVPITLTVEDAGKKRTSYKVQATAKATN